MLTSVGFNSTGTEILYNGQSGEQLEANMYIGPTYYMRLKHMVKDKKTTETEVLEQHLHDNQYKAEQMMVVYVLVKWNAMD